MDLKNIIYLYANDESTLEKPSVWVIFGAGERGRQLFQILANQNILIDYYCDNDIKKQGTVIDGIPCMSINDLKLKKESYCIIVSPYNGHQLFEDLKERGFHYVVSPDIFNLVAYMDNKSYCDGKDNFFPFGHFYSLYPNMKEMHQKEQSLFSDDKVIADIDFNEDIQKDFLKKMTTLYDTIPNWENMSVPLGTTNLRHRYGNPSLSPGDAIGLHCMLRILQSKRLIEVGSGYTSAVTLDTNEFYLENKIDLKFIEPYPTLLQSLLKKSDKVELMPTGLQEIPLSTFEQLDSGDILFIDSTHVSKIGSDVNYLFFEILPSLKKGVYIHLHDIFYPFEYPKQWIYSGMIWNELYLLRAFLQNNKDYEIIFFQNMMEKKYMNLFLEKWPLQAPVHGGSFWLRKKF
ncbi:MAG TPA: hypothetical protein VN258_02805 [Mobilitalea sp.]|nr:hypothetical protein [Mobilitalea sp.]